jgi:hypothetical protein
MSRETGSGKRSGTAAGLVLAAAVGALALPSAVLAFSTGITVRPVADADKSESLSSVSAPTVDASLAQAISMRMMPKGQAFRFTPAGTATRPDRSITVAVRVDADSARAISVSKGTDSKPGLGGLTALRIAPTAFNLGVSRGYQAFGQSGSVIPQVRKIDMPDLSAFGPGSSVNDDPARFSTRLLVDEREHTGRAPRTFETAGQQTVDLGGSYRLTGNLNVTAGVRYSHERDRLAPLTDGKQDSQAVYVGTQFRF